MNAVASCKGTSTNIDNGAGSGHFDAALSAVRTVRVALFIRTFGIGGAEQQVLELARHLDKRKYEVVVIALRGGGELKGHFHSLAGLQVVNLTGKNPLTALYRLVDVIQKNEIQVLHSFLTATNIYSLVTKLFLPRVKVIIGLRDSLPDFYMGYNSLAWRLKLWMLKSFFSGLSRFGDLYVSNSEAGKILYERELGVRVEVEPSGTDTERFRPDPAARGLLRGTVGAPSEAKLVGILANCSIYKDYPTFIRTAKIIADSARDVHFISIGDYQTAEGAAARELVQQAGLENVFHFLGTRRDAPELLAGLDVLCSSSVTEGFPNAIVEAMACGVPCVVTDVGDSRKIVGDTGIVVSPGKPESLAAGVATLLNLDATEKQQLSSRTRERVVRNFDVAGMANRHARLYEMLTSGETLHLETVNPSI